MPEKTISSFPSFGVAPPAAFHQSSSGGAGRRGFLQFAGEHAGSEFVLGEWCAADAAVGTGLAGTGPLCVFDETLVEVERVEWERHFPPGFRERVAAKYLAEIYSSGGTAKALPPPHFTH